MTVSLKDLNLKAKCSVGYTFEPTDPSGKPYGFHLTVLGAHAPVVQNWINERYNKRQEEEALTGKPSLERVENGIKFVAEYAAIRIIGWDGIAEKYSPENAIELCADNVLIAAQVSEVSENLANFTQGK